MTRKQLEAYRSMQEEISELKYKLQHLGEGDSMINNSTIMDYRSGYPIPQAVVGVDWDKLGKLRERYISRIAQLQKECDGVEAYIEGIEDSITRRIFRMRFIDGLSLKQIGRTVHLDKSNISRKIENFLKSQRTQQMQHYNNT